jgi:hypothetical protein
MIELTHATQQALARIATAPATSEQAQRSAVAELLEVAEILARHTSRQDLADRAEAAVERVRTTLAQPKPNHHSDSNWAWVADAVAVAEQRREAP